MACCYKNNGNNKKKKANILKNVKMKCVEVLKMKITFEAEKIRLKYQNEQANGQKVVEHFFSLAYRIKNKNS